MARSTRRDNNQQALIQIIALDIHKYLEPYQLQQNCRQRSLPFAKITSRQSPSADILLDIKVCDRGYFGRFVAELMFWRKA